MENNNNIPININMLNCVTTRLHINIYTRFDLQMYNMTIDKETESIEEKHDIPEEENIVDLEEEQVVINEINAFSNKKVGSKKSKTTTMTVQEPDAPIITDPTKVSLNLEELEGIGKATADKLRGYGINDIPSLALSQAQELIEKLSPGGSAKNVSHDSCVKLIITANTYLQVKGVLSKPLMGSKDLLQRNKDRKRFTTNSLEIDNFFGGGGFESRAVTEIYGAFGSGKSQICFSSTVSAAAMGRKVLYIDTENTYSPERIEEIAELKGYDTDKVHNNIMVLKPATVSMFTLFIDHLEEYVSKNQFELIIVDSIIALHKSEYFGRGALAPRQQGLTSIMSKLLRVAEFYDVGVIITNHIIANPDPYTPGTEIAAGGNSIAHFSTHRIYLQKKGIKKPYTAATIVDSPRMPKNQTLLELKPEGIIWKNPAEA